MLAIVITITLLHSHRVVTLELSKPTYHYGDECKEAIEDAEAGVRRLANRLYPERTQVSLACKRAKYIGI